MTEHTPADSFTFIPAPPSADERISAVEAKVDALTEKVDALLASRPGRRGKPIVVQQEGVCGVDPSCDPAECESASVYRWQKGCRGEACVTAYRTYYSVYRKKRRGTDSASVEPSLLVDVLADYDAN